MEDEDPLGGQVLDGYRLVRFLGRGGFGEVWLCRSEAMGSYHALKFIARTNHEVSEREYQALTLYRKTSGMLRSPHLVPIEHINRNAAGLYYVMPLADGVAAGDPVDPAWQPLSLAAMIQAQAAQPAWFSSAEIAATLCSLLNALQTLSDAGLVHRDVKPENILILNGEPCLGDISLLGSDTSMITRRGTPGYATPSWYVGGHPDMYGIAATLYTLLTGNSPDRMGRTAFLWPPQGKSSLTDTERGEWKRLHGIIRRATDEKVSERFVDFAAMANSISGVSGNEQPATRRLPRILWASLMVATIAAAILVAAFHGKQPDPAPPPASDRTRKDPAPELTADEKADYRALAGMIQGYIGKGEYANALASVETLLATYPQARTQPAYSIARAMALKGLGRIDEAKEELKKDIHLSPSITAMAGRKDLWEQLGDLAEAENDLTRILENFGPNTFVLFLRADVRAKRGNFAGVVADQQDAYAIKPDEPEQRGLADDMWAPLETKYPDYGIYLKNQRAEAAGVRPEGQHEAQPAEVPSMREKLLKVIPSVIVAASKVGNQGPDLAEYSRQADIRTAYQKRDYSTCLALLDERLKTYPDLRNNPACTLFRALLLKLLDRTHDVELELSRANVEPGTVRTLNDLRRCQVNQRIILWEALGCYRQAEEFLSKIIPPVVRSLTDSHSGQGSLVVQDLYNQRARMRILGGDFAGALADEKAALALPPEPFELFGREPTPAQLQQSLLNTIVKDWGLLEEEFPAYAAYLEANGSPEPKRDSRNLYDDE